MKYLLDNGAKKVMVLGGGESSDAEDKNNDNIDRPEYLEKERHDWSVFAAIIEH